MIKSIDYMKNKKIIKDNDVDFVVYFLDYVPITESVLGGRNKSVLSKDVQEKLVYILQNPLKNKYFWHTSGTHRGRPNLFKIGKFLKISDVTVRRYYLPDDVCRQVENQRKNDWKKENKEVVKSYTEEYRTKNKSKNLEYMKKYRRLNSNKYDKEYYKKNRKKILEQRRIWYAKNKEKISKQRKELKLNGDLQND